MQAFRDLGGARLMPVHWGMFDLSTHNWWDPIETITSLALEHALPLMTPKIGQLIDLEAPPQVVPWWRSLMPTEALPGARTRTGAARLRRSTCSEC
jgi:hypothetical protein